MSSTLVCTNTQNNMVLGCGVNTQNSVITINNVFTNGSGMANAEVLFISISTVRNPARA